MNVKEISNGVVHRVPDDLRKALVTSSTSSSASISATHKAWEDITPLARNEWICWIESAKKPETRAHRIARTRAELAKGKRRPCCWAGCPHR